MEYLYKKEIKIPLYRGKLIVILTNDKIKLQKYIPDFGDDEIYAHSILSSWYGSDGFIVILNFNNKHRKIHFGTITHESVHLSHFIATERGFIADYKNDEPITYLAEWISDEIYKFILKNNFNVS